MTKNEDARRPTLWFILILGALSAFGPLSIDMFLPALPEVQQDFHTTTSSVQLTLSCFMIGLALGNLFVGPLSDAIGRKKPLFMSMAIFTLASIGILFTESITVMIILRFIQGFTGGAGAVISRAISSDMYHGKALTKFLAMLMLVNGVAPIIAPAIGGVLLLFTTWRTVFLILTIFGVIMLLGSQWKLPESLPKAQRETGGIRAILSGFKSLLTTRRFMSPLVIQALTYVLLFSYISASPFLVQKVYEASPQTFSVMFAVNGMGLIMMSQVVSWLVDRYPMHMLLRMFTILQIIGVLLVACVLLWHLPLALLFIGFFILISPVAAIGTLGFSIAMDERTAGNGSASSLLGLVQFMLGGMVAPLVGIRGEHDIMPFVYIILTVAIGLVIAHIAHYRIFKQARTH